MNLLFKIPDSGFKESVHWWPVSYQTVTLKIIEKLSLYSQLLHSVRVFYLAPGHSVCHFLWYVLSVSETIVNSLIRVCIKMLVLQPHLLLSIGSEEKGTFASKIIAEWIYKKPTRIGLLSLLNILLLSAEFHVLYLWNASSYNLSNSFGSRVQNWSVNTMQK